MLEFISNNIGTAIVVIILILIVGAIIRTLIQDKKKGKSSCGGHCAGCANSQYCHSQTQKKQ